MNGNYIDEAAAAALGVGDLSIETNMTVMSSLEQPQMAIAEDPMAKKLNYSGGGAAAMAASSPTATLSSPIILNFGNAITPVATVPGDPPQKSVAFVGELSLFSDGSCPEWKKMKSARATRPRDHIIAERKRREKISQRLLVLSELVPGLKKCCRRTRSITLEAMKHAKQLLERLITLEEEISKGAVEPMVVVKTSQAIVEDEHSFKQSKFHQP